MPGMDSVLVSKMSISEWLPAWFNHLKIYDKAILILGCISLLINVVLLKKEVLYIGIILAIGGLFWFLSAPDMRFGYGIFISSIAILVAMMMEKYNVKTKNTLYPSCIILSLTLMVALVGITQKEEVLSVKYLLQEATIPTFAVQRWEKDTSIYVPIEGDRCGDYPLPCTPFPTHFKKIGTKIEDGFMWKEGEKNGN
jgi:hypothetical protein